MTTTAPESLSPVQALVFVRLPQPDRARFRRFLTDEPAVRAGWRVVGDIDLVLHVSCRDLPELDRLISTMRVRGGATATSTHLVVGTAIHTPLVVGTTEPRTAEPRTAEPRAAARPGAVRRRPAPQGRQVGDLSVGTGAGR